MLLLSYFGSPSSVQVFDCFSLSRCTSVQAKLRGRHLGAAFDCDGAATWTSLVCSRGNCEGSNTLSGGWTQRCASDDGSDSWDRARSKQRHNLRGCGGGDPQVIARERRRVDPYWPPDANDHVDQCSGRNGLSLIGMGAAKFKLTSPLQGAVAQEVIDLLSILNSLRMILPTGPFSDFHQTGLV